MHNNARALAQLGDPEWRFAAMAPQGNRIDPRMRLHMAYARTSFFDLPMRSLNVSSSFFMAES